MAAPSTPGSKPENPQFAVINGLMENYIGALGLAKEMQDKAHLDPLTGLPNRLALEQTYAGLQGSAGLHGEQQRQRASDPSHSEVSDDTHSLLMIDLDHFKKINDTRGHDKGNRILRKVAGLLTDHTRSNDLSARIGGEEFAVLLPRTNTEQAMQVAEQLRNGAEETGDVKLSVGVAGVDLHKTLEDNLINADTALYNAKEHGRNQVVRYEDLVAQSKATSGSPA